MTNYARTRWLILAAAASSMLAAFSIATTFHRHLDLAQALANPFVSLAQQYVLGSPCWARQRVPVDVAEMKAHPGVHFIDSIMVDGHFRLGACVADEPLRASWLR